MRYAPRGRIAGRGAIQAPPPSEDTNGRTYLALAALPTAIERALLTVVSPDDTPDAYRRAVNSPRLKEAFRSELLSWITLIELLEEVLGTDDLRATLVERYTDLVTGFNGVGGAVLRVVLERGDVTVDDVRDVLANSAMPKTHVETIFEPFRQELRARPESETVDMALPGSGATAEAAAALRERLNARRAATPPQHEAAGTAPSAAISSGGDDQRQGIAGRRKPRS